MIHPDSVSSNKDPNQLGVQKIRTMIDGFDDISHGGLPIGRTTLVSGTSGTGKTLLAIQFLYNSITYFGEAGIFVTFEESPVDIIKNAHSFGWNLQRLMDEGKLFILDASLTRKVRIL
jgi:circadian clock protein KaiC